MNLPSYIRHFDVDRGIQYLMVGAAVVLVSLLYPSSVKFKYEFQRGQEWRYADLYAPFDFPIQRSGAAISAEQAYDRVVETRTGRARKVVHDRRHEPCQWICHGGSCMIYVPFARRYGSKRLTCPEPP